MSESVGEFGLVLQPHDTVLVIPRYQGDLPNVLSPLEGPLAT